jgi:hypothetical protein
MATLDVEQKRSSGDIGILVQHQMDAPGLNSHAVAVVSEFRVCELQIPGILSKPSDPPTDLAVKSKEPPSFPLLGEIYGNIT